MKNRFFSFLIVMGLSINFVSAEQNCHKINICDEEKLNQLQQQAVSFVVKSNVFKHRVSKLPENSRFSFIITNNENEDCSLKCKIQVDLYIDEIDHLSYIDSFIVENEKSIYLIIQ